MKLKKPALSYKVLQVTLAMLAVLVFLLRLPMVRAAGMPEDGRWSFTPTADIFLALIMDRPAIGYAGHLLLS